MKLKIITILCFTCSAVFGQLHKIAADSILIISQWDGSWDDMQTLYAKLLKIGNSPYKYHFRYSENNQIADIYSNDSISFNGRVLNNLVMIDNNNTAREKNFKDYYVFNYTEIDPEAATKIGRFIISEHLSEIPTMHDDLSEWGDMFFGCKSIGLDYKMDNIINEKGYHCPQGQKNDSKDVTKIKKLHKDLQILFGWKKLFEDFINKLEKDKEYYDGWDAWYNSP